jgi:hypothetical protein
LYEVAQDSSRPGVRKLYSVAGRFLLIESRDRRLAELVDSLLERWFLTEADASEQPPHVNIAFHSDEPLPRIPDGLDHFEVADSGHCYTNGNGLYLDLSNALMHLGQGNPVDVNIWIKQYPVTPDPALDKATSFAICAALRRYGIFEFHSAAVVSPDAKTGVMIIGPSGSGKSTLTMQLAAAGWPYLSDDMLLLSLCENEVEARSFRRAFAITENTALISGLRIFEDASCLKENGREIKRCFEPQIVFPAAQMETVKPSFLLFTRVNGEAQTRLCELSKAETMKRLIRACPWATYDKTIAVGNLNMLSRLARQAKSFDLSAGADLMHPKRASDLLRSYTGV